MNEEPAPLSWYQKPIWQGLLGLALVVGGWKVSTFVPASPGDGTLAEVRRMADDEELARRLDRLADNVRGEPPYRMPGRLLLVAGLVLFVAAGVRMYQAPARVAEEESANR